MTQLDQKNKADGGKIRLSLLLKDMWSSVSHVAAVLTYGAEKYEDSGWQKVDPKRYWDAFHRHHVAYSSGEKYDEESGLHHLAHLACNAMFLLWFELRDLGDPKPSWNKPPQSHKNLVTKS